jgi:hypothetical protein
MAEKICGFVSEARECRRIMTQESSGNSIAAVIFRCELGHTLYQNTAGNVGFRRDFYGDTWHFLSDCYKWPVKGFASRNYMSGDTPICNECLVMSAEKS